MPCFRVPTNLKLVASYVLNLLLLMLGSARIDRLGCSRCKFGESAAPGDKLAVNTLSRPISEWVNDTLNPGRRLVEHLLLAGILNWQVSWISVSIQESKNTEIIRDLHTPIISCIHHIKNPEKHTLNLTMCLQWYKLISVIENWLRILGGSIHTCRIYVGTSRLCSHTCSKRWSKIYKSMPRQVACRRGPRSQHRSSSPLLALYDRGKLNYMYVDKFQTARRIPEEN